MATLHEQMAQGVKKSIETNPWSTEQAIRRRMSPQWQKEAWDYSFQETKDALVDQFSSVARIINISESAMILDENGDLKDIEPNNVTVIREP